MPLYLYGLVRSGCPVPTGAAPVEPATGDLVRLDHGALGVLASPVGSRLVPATTRNFEARHRVVEEATRRGAVLPFRFGTVVESPECLQAYLRRQERVLARQLERFEDLVEVKVTARHWGDHALQEVLRSCRRIRRLHARIELRREAARDEDRIALGAQLIAGLAELRRRDAESLSARLRSVAEAERRLPSDSDQTVLHAAYLVRASKLRDFDRKLASAGSRQASRIELSFAGPLAPWDFLELTVDEPGETTRPRPRTLARLRTAA